ncbi:BrnT family toxin [Mesorhizobium australicum]|uniref:Uncharacterized protein n=1 Tax=Mesorhizobium australicum TaxID=536018 RepID=A0A1X7PJ42_9HYPH|nr:BrnT family toxin [Mesorhizobium australicum]SMH50717.1 hypothetical protein SAMN02982922_4253 [Mesorhizobium australicum]
MKRVEAIEFSEFDWDPTKYQKVLVTREIDFLQIAAALLGPHLSQRSDKQGEDRTLAICMIETQIVRVIYTSRGSVCRIITAMAARRNEREEYRQIFG